MDALLNLDLTEADRHDAFSVKMDCGWRLHPLLSAIDFSDKSERGEQFSCPQSEQIALSVDVSVSD